MFSTLTNNMIRSKDMTDPNLQMNRCLDILLNTIFYSDSMTV
jgi:hypothetical protein